MKAVGGKWKSYRENLPVNSALPFLLPYEEDEVIEPVTLNEPVMWEEPLTSNSPVTFDAVTTP